MFERVLETVLTKALGEFVQDIDSKDLKLAVWSGKYKLLTFCISVLLLSAKVHSKIKEICTNS